MKVVTADKGRVEKFMESGQGTLYPGRIDEHLDKERKSKRKKGEKEHFKKYEEAKREVFRKELKGRDGLKSHWRLKKECNTGKYCGVFYFILFLSGNEEMEEKRKGEGENMRTEDVKEMKGQGEKEQRMR